MKFSRSSAIAALALAAVLAACGGKAMFTVQGSVVGLNNSGLVLANGSDTVTVPSGATSFSFPQQIAYGSGYNITLTANPAHMTCSVGNGEGSAGHTVEIQAIVSCSQNAYSLGGQFTGFTAGTMVLTNGTSGGTVTLAPPTDLSGAGDFAFATAVLDGSAYGVTILTPPDGYYCTVSNGTGVMHETPVTNVLVACTKIQ